MSRAVKILRDACGLGELSASLLRDCSNGESFSWFSVIHDGFSLLGESRTVSEREKEMWRRRERKRYRSRATRERRDKEPLREREREREETNETRNKKQKGKKYSKLQKWFTNSCHVREVSYCCEWLCCAWWKRSSFTPFRGFGQARQHFEVEKEWLELKDSRK